MLGRFAIDDRNITSLVHLQALFCMVLVLVADSKISAAHTYMVTATTTIRRFGSSTDGSSDVSLSRSASPSVKTMLKAALLLDTYICGLLGVPLVLLPVLAEMAMVEEGEPLTNMTQLVSDERHVLEAVACELQLELFGVLPSNGIISAEAGISAETSSQQDQRRAVLLDKIHEAEKQLHSWSVRFGRSFPQGEVGTPTARYGCRSILCLSR